MLAEQSPIFHTVSSSKETETSAASPAPTRKLKLIAFDLDGTLWQPQLNQLGRDGGAPFTPRSTREVIDVRGQSIILLAEAASILHELKTDSRFEQLVVCWCSRTENPAWAQILLGTFHTLPPEVEYLPPPPPLEESTQPPPPPPAAEAAPASTEAATATSAATTSAEAAAAVSEPQPTSPTTTSSLPPSAGTDSAGGGGGGGGVGGGGISADECVPLAISSWWSSLWRSLFFGNSQQHQQQQQAHPSLVPWPLITVARPPHASQIYAAESKAVHFAKIKELFPELSFHEMLFFDDELHNIETVRSMGVAAVHAHEGLTREAFERGLAMFDEDFA